MSIKDDIKLRIKI